jgi:hypothetical protein
MLATLCLAAVLHGGTARPQDDARLSKQISLREEIISLEDLTAKLSKETGIRLSARRRVADRKVTIVFQDRPASEAMQRVTDCMFVAWYKVRDGYELDLTSEASAAETSTQASEREAARGGLRDAVREIRRLWSLSPDARKSEVGKLELSYANARKAGESLDSPRMQLLNSQISALHMGGFIEVTGPALTAAQLDNRGVPLGTVWFASADVNDPVGQMQMEGFPTGKRSGGYADAIGIVTYKEQNHELATRLLATPVNGAGTIQTSVGGWSIPTSNSTKPSELERLMESWQRPLSPEMSAKQLQEPKGEAPPSEFCSNMYGRAQHLADLADRSGVPVVADAFRRSFSQPMRLPGKTVGEWAKAYDKASKARWKGRPDVVREEKGWLLFREDHWWWSLSSEIPESDLAPLEAKAGKSRAPLVLDDYAKFVSRLTPQQISPLERPADVLLRFPIGSLGTASHSMRLFAFCGPDDRGGALSRQGLDLSTASAQAQAVAYEALMRICVDSGDMPFVRAVLRGTDVLKGFRFFAEDEAAKATDPAKIGGGRDINMSFSYGTSYNSSPHMQTFVCSKAGP